MDARWRPRRPAGGKTGWTAFLGTSCAIFCFPLPGKTDSAPICSPAAWNPEDVAGVILESIPGVTTACHPLEYVRELRAWATRHRVLIAVDEIQCGMGRTGKDVRH